MKKSASDDHYPEREAEQRREVALKRMLATPHKPHKMSRNKSNGSHGKRASTKK